MKIDPKKIISMYETQTNRVIPNSGDKKESLDSTIIRGGQDRIELSRRFVKHDEIQTMKANIASQIEKGTSAEKLAQLKYQIKKGTYHVPAEQIAAAIIKIK